MLILEQVPRHNMSTEYLNNLQTRLLKWVSAVEESQETENHTEQIGKLIHGTKPSPKYDSEVIEQIPAGENARSKALEREKYHSKRYPHMKKYGKHIKP